MLDLTLLYVPGEKLTVIKEKGERAWIFVFRELEIVACYNAPLVHKVESLLKGGGIKTCREKPVPFLLHLCLLPEEGSQAPNLTLQASSKGSPRILVFRSVTKNILPAIPPQPPPGTQCPKLFVGWRLALLHFEPTSSILDLKLRDLLHKVTSKSPIQSSVFWHTHTMSCYIHATTLVWDDEQWFRCIGIRTWGSTQINGYAIQQAHLQEVLLPVVWADKHWIKMHLHQNLKLSSLSHVLAEVLWIQLHWHQNPQLSWQCAI